MSDAITSAMAGARVGDPIKHKSFWGALAGAAAGAVIETGILMACGGGIGLVIGLVLLDIPVVADTINSIKNKVESLFESDSPDGFIIKGSPNVFVAYAALVDQSITIQCNNHDKQRIVQGSETVFVNDNPVARKGDRTTCDGVISQGSPNVFFGSGQAMVAPIEPEFSLLQRALIVGIEFVVPPSRALLKSFTKFDKIRRLVNSAIKGPYLGSVITSNLLKSWKKSIFRRNKKIDPTLNFNPINATKKQKANFGEIKADNYLRIPRNNLGNSSKSYNLERIGKEVPKSLDDKIQQGIDGVYRNKTPPPDFVINEVKYGKSKLSRLRDGTKQMSDNWIKNRLQHLDKRTKAEILDSIDKGNVDRILSKVDKYGNVEIFKLDSNARIIGKWL